MTDPCRHLTRCVDGACSYRIAARERWEDVDDCVAEIESKAFVPLLMNYATHGTTPHVRTRTVQDLYDDLAAAKTPAEMRAVVERETAYQAGEADPAGTALANIRWVAGYGSEDVRVRAMRLLSDV